jgi:hypothetical protein
MVETRYKFLRSTEGKRTSEHGDHTWKKGQWYVTAEVALCESGFHCSQRMGQAFSYVQGELVARVEVRGLSEAGADKEAWSEMRLTDVRKWRKQDSVALSVFAAELVLNNFEKLYPNDDRPRKAIEAARLYMSKPTKANASAAYSAANSAYSAAY